MKLDNRPELLAAYLRGLDEASEQWRDREQMLKVYERGLKLIHDLTTSKLSLSYNGLAGTIRMVKEIARKTLEDDGCDC